MSSFLGRNNSPLKQNSRSNCGNEQLAKMKGHDDILMTALMYVGTGTAEITDGGVKPT